MIINPAWGVRDRDGTTVISNDISRNRAGYIAKYHCFLYLLPFSYSGIDWRNSSRIVVKACVDFSRRFCIPVLPEKPDDVDFCLAISWKKDDVVYRRKLWEDVSEICYYPMYDKEIIESIFYLEVWNTSDETTVSLAESLKITLSVHDKFAFVGELVSHYYRGCTDKMLDFTDGFNGMTDIFNTVICPGVDGTDNTAGKIFYTDEDGNVYVDMDGISGYTP